MILEFVPFSLRTDGKAVVDGTTAMVENGSGATVLADATSAAGSVAASGPLPTAGTMPTCFEAVATEASPFFAKDDNELVGEGKDVVTNAGEAVDNGTGGSALADAASPAGSVAASGPLPTAGTLPICFEVVAVEP